MTAALRGSGGEYDQMVKKLVRLALASEYSRQPIRRNDITAKGSFFFLFFWIGRFVMEFDREAGSGKGGGKET